MRIPGALLLAVLLVMACNNDPRKKLPSTGLFGNAIQENKALTVQEAMPMFSTSSSVDITVTGTIQEYCTGEGCWLTLANPGGAPLFVEIENHAFVLPYHISGKTAIVSGKTSTTKTPQGGTEPMISATGILIK